MQNGTRSEFDWRTLVLIAFCIAVVAQAALLAVNRDRMDRLETALQALKTAAVPAATEATPAMQPAQPQPVVLPTAPPVAAPQAASASKAVVAPLSNGTKVVRLITIWKKAQMTPTVVETSDAFDECGKDLDLTICIAGVEGKKMMPVLAVGKNGMNEEQAKNAAICFNRKLTPPEGGDNAAEVADRAEFTECHPLN